MGRAQAVTVEELDADIARVRDTLRELEQKRANVVLAPDFAAKMGRAGGQATAANRTPEERSEAARKAVQARWRKAGKGKKEK